MGPAILRYFTSLVKFKNQSLKTQIYFDLNSQHQVDYYDAKNRYICNPYCHNARIILGVVMIDRKIVEHWIMKLKDLPTFRF